jgi:hypothetical protein
MKRLLICIPCAFGFFSQAVSQVSVQLTLLNQAVEVFFLKDFDINSPASGLPFFQLTATNTTAAPVTFTLYMRVSARGGAARPGGLLAQGQTDPITLQGNGVLQLTNQNLFSDGDQFSLQDYRIEKDQVEDLVSDILTTGKLPSDVYNFYVEPRIIVNGVPTIGPSDQFDVRIDNPDRLDLIGPGGPAGRRDCPTAYTSLPLIRFESNLTKFRFVAAKLERGEDPESALNQEPRLTRLFILASDRGINDIRSTGTIPDLGVIDKVEFLPSNSFQWPSVGEVLQLRPGDTIVWRMTGIIQTSSGPIQLIESEIFCFTVADFEALGTGRESYDFLLRSLLGADFDKLFEEGGELEGFRPNGVSHNGERVSPADLMSRLSELSKKYKGYRIE